MTQTTSARRHLKPIAVGFVVVSAAITGSLVHLSAPAPLSLASLASLVSPAPSLTAADGILPDAVSVFDDEYPGVAKLAPELVKALRAAATDAADDGVEFNVNSGWRSPAYQDHLRREAIMKYGSEQKAARWVSTPETSAHVSGNAVDIGPFAATDWLSRHGSRYGLCQIYGNESWHFELRPKAASRGCPTMYADPTHDPRTQR